MSKKKLLIIIGIVALVVLTGIIIILTKKPNNSNNNDNNNNNNNDVYYNQEENLFTVQSILSNFVLNYNLASPNELYSYLDSSYIEENQITIDNIENIVDKYYYFPSYYVRKVLTKTDSEYTLFYVSGFITDDSSVGSVYENANFLVILKGNLYSVRPLNNSQTIYDLYNNYSINTDNMVLKKEKPVIDHSDKSKILLYISLFQRLLNVDPELAYQYYDTNTNYDSFNLITDDLYYALSFDVENIEYDYKDSKRVYNISLTNNEKIIIYENQITDFKIDFLSYD